MGRASTKAREGRRGGDWLALALILLIGLTLRVSYLHEVTTSPVFTAPIADAAFHDYWARGIVSGNWTPPLGELDPRISQVPYLRPPGYPYFLALEYALTGESLTGVRVIQMLLGLVNAVLAFLLGRAVFNRAVGLIMGGFAATYWVFIYYEAQLHSPVLSIALGLGLLLALHRWVQRPAWPPILIAGVLLGLSALVRTEALLFLPLAAAWIWWYGRGRLGPRPLATHVAVMILGTLALVSAATIRNAVVAHEFCLVSANGGVNFYVGNNETADGITTRIPFLAEETGSAGWSCFSYDQVVSAISRREGRKLTYGDASAYFTRLAREYITSHPGDFLRLSARRLLLFLGPNEVANNQADDMEKRNSPTLRFLPGFPWVLSLAILGLVLLILERRSAEGRERRRAGADTPTLVAIGLFVLASTVAFVPFIVAGRFRVPMIPFLFLFGAYALYRVGLFVRSRNWTRAGIAVAVWVPLFALAHLSLAGYDTDPAWWHTDRALALQRHGDLQGAFVEFQAALAENPGFVDAHVNLASLLADAGRLDEAIQHYQLVVGQRPTRVDVRLKLGMALRQRGNAQEAVRELREVVRQNPSLAEGQFELGLALLDAREYQAAIDAFDACLLITPDEPGAHVNRGIALMRMNRRSEAIQSLQRAIQIKPDFETAYSWLGRAYAGEGDLERARGAFQEAFRLDPKSADPLVNLAFLASQKGAFEEAATWYRRALEIEPDNIITHQNLAVAYAELGRMDDAAKQLREVLRLDPNNRVARERLDQLESGQLPGAVR